MKTMESKFDLSSQSPPGGHSLVRHQEALDFYACYDEIQAQMS